MTREEIDLELEKMRRYTMESCWLAVVKGLQTMNSRWRTHWMLKITEQFVLLEKNMRPVHYKPEESFHAACWGCGKEYMMKVNDAPFCTGACEASYAREMELVVAPPARPLPDVRPDRWNDGERPMPGDDF